MLSSTEQLVSRAIKTPANARILNPTPADRNFMPFIFPTHFAPLDYENVDPSAGWGSFLCCGNAMNLNDSGQTIEWKN